MTDEIKLNDETNTVEQINPVVTLEKNSEPAPATDQPWYTQQESLHTSYSPWVDVLAAADAAPQQAHTNLPQIYREDPVLNQRMRKKLSHDLAYTEGGENAVLNIFESQSWDEQYSNILTPEEAHTLSKELGQEIKFERNVTEGNVRFSVEKQLQKKSIEEALAYYKSTGSHGALQDLSLMASSISGSFGGIETAATVVSGFLLYPFIGAAGAAVASGASKVPGLTNVAKGVRLAQKAMALEKKAQLARNNSALASNLLSKAGRYADIAKARGGFASVAYDSLRYTNMANGKAASLLSTMIPFAVDGALADTPRLLAIRQNEELIHSNDFTTQDMVNEMLLAGVFSASIPLAGGALKAAGSVCSRAWNGVAEHWAKQANQKATQAYIKGRKGEAKAYEEAGNQISATIRQTAEMTQTPMPSFVKQSVEATAASNLSDAEKSDVLTHIITSIEAGTVPNVDALPHKNKLLSHCPYLVKVLEDGKNLNLTDAQIIQDLEKVGIKVEKGLPRSGTGAILEDSIRAGKMISVSLNDTGLLGKNKAFGFSLKGAQNFLLDVYRYHMLDDVKSGLRAEASITRMEDAWFKLTKVIEQYNTYFEMNKAFKDGVPGATRVGFKKQVYQLDNGRYGYLIDAVEEVLDLMLSPEEAYALAYARGNIAPSDYKKAMTPEFKKMMEDVVEHRNKQLENILVEVHSDEKAGIVVHDLVGRDITKVKEVGETSFLGKLTDDLSNAIEENRRLLDTDKTLQKEFETQADELWYQAQTGAKQLDETLGIKPSEATVEDLRIRSTTVEGSHLRLGKSREEYTAFVDDARNMEAISVFEKFAGKLHKDFQEGQRSIRSLFNSSSDVIARTAALLKEDLSGLRTEMLTSIQRASFFEKMEKELSTLREQIDEIRAGMGIEDINPPELDDLEKQYADATARYAQILKSPDNPLRLTFMENVMNPLREVAKEDLLNTREINKVTDEMLQAFANKVETDENFVTQLLGKAKAAEGETISAPDVLLDEAFRPALEKLAMLVMDIQNAEIRTQLNLLKDWTEIYKAPALGKEYLYSISTFTPIAKKGTALSIENLSDITQTYREFLKALADRSSSTEKQAGETLSEFFNNPETQDQIQEAIYYVTKYTPAELAEKNIKLNDKAARVAQIYNEFMSREGVRLHDLGSNKIGKTSMLKKSSLSFASYTLPDGIVPRAIQHLQSITGIDTYINRFFGRSEQAGLGDAFISGKTAAANAMRDRANAKLGQYLFINLDLDAMFNKMGTLRIKLNDIRDAVLNGTVRELDEKDVQRGMKIISDQIFGNIDTAADKKHFGLIGRIQTGTRNSVDSYNCSRARYIEDMDDVLIFKDDESALRAMKFWGHDNAKDLVEANLQASRRAQAILHRVGIRPKVYMEELMDVFSEYISSGDAYARLGQEAINRIQLTENDKVKILTNLATVTGVLGTPAGFGSRLCKIISQFIGSPMLMKAGLKSLSDYYYQHQYLVTAGVRSGTDVNLWIDTIRRMANVMESKELAEHLLVNVGLRNDTILRAVTNSETVLDPKSLKEIFMGDIKGYNRKQNFNSMAPEILKWEARADQWANTFVNNIAWVGPITEYNRNNATLSIMEGLGSFANTKFGDMSNELKQTLLRHGITGYEWDNILSKHCVMSSDEYARKLYGEGSKHLADHQMFFADLITEVDDETLRQHIHAQRMLDAEDEIKFVLQQERGVREENPIIQKQIEHIEQQLKLHNNGGSLEVQLRLEKKLAELQNKLEADPTDAEIGAHHIRARYNKEITPEDIRNYRELLSDKAAILVNISANEMTSLPNARVQNMLNGYVADPNSLRGVAMQAVTKFQSFGMAVTQIQFGRKLASHMNEDRDSYLFRNVLESAFATPEQAGETTKDLLGFLVSCTLVNALINDAIAMTGRRKGWTNEEGEFNWDKISSALSQATGIMGPIYDGIMSAFVQRGQGGGINFSVLPVPSAAIRAASNVTSALTRESTEGARAQALAGAMIQNVGDLTGLSRHALTQAAWIWLIGDRAKKWSMGEQAWRQHIRRLQREGFQNLPSLEFTN